MCSLPEHLPWVTIGPVDRVVLSTSGPVRVAAPGKKAPGAVYVEGANALGRDLLGAGAFALFASACQDCCTSGPCG
jgi:hypothetical protein